MTDDIMDNEPELTGLEIAIVGMALRFPGAMNVERFWENLREGVESIRFFSDEELLAEGITREELDQPNYIKANGYLEGIDYFDASFFGYSPAEAILMDPQLRLFHECAWEAFEDAACVPDTFGGAIGVYFGATDNLAWKATALTAGVTTGNRFADMLLCKKDLYSSRLSYRLNLGGPCVAVNSACSTSLAAIHLACRGLLGGECDMALAGGASISMPRKHGYVYFEGMIESPDGHCRSFDKDAAGTVFGSGVGVVLLKRLEDALEDGNPIHAVIKGSAMNNDGCLKVGYTAPGVDGQAGVIAEALSVAETDSESISYIEAHGTATALGDPIEIKALNRAMKSDQTHRCAIGTVKSNLGHLDCASGVAGIIKTVLALKHRMIPPSLHFREANPELKLEETPFYVNNRLTEWKRTGNDPLRAGVSSFGIGGTNAHVILEEWRQGKGETGSPGDNHPQLLVLSAKSEEALTAMAVNLGDYIHTHPEARLADVAHTLQTGRKAFGWRGFLVCNDKTEAAQILKTPGLPGLKRLSANEELRHTVFMFSGQGSQYVNMGQDLYEKVPLFQEEADRCFDILRNLTGTDYKEILYPAVGRGKGEAINGTAVTQPVLLVFEYALAKLLIHWGIRPDALIGYSFGEYMAACLAGVFSIEDALALVVLRGRLMGELPEGAMLSVPMPEAELRPLLGDGLSIAIVNEPACIVAGPPEAVNVLEEQMKQRRLMCMRLNISFAAHSSLMEEAAVVFEQKLKQVQFSAPVIPYISGITGDWITSEAAQDYGYWLKHLRETIRFSAGVQRLLSEKQSIFLEIGPGRDLTVLVNRYITETKTSPPSTGIQGGPPLGPRRAPGGPPEASKKQYAYNLVRPEAKKESDIGYLMRRLGRLWLLRQVIDWGALSGGAQRRLLGLPVYPFQRKQYWWERGILDMGILEEAAAGKRPGGPLERMDIADWFYVPSWKRKETGFLPIEYPEHCLILSGTEDPGDGLAEVLAAEGVDTVVATMGDRFARSGRNRYIIDETRFGDYERLLGELSGQGRLPQWIFHLVNISHETGFLTQGSGSHDVEEAVYTIGRTQNRAFYSPIFLVQAIGSLGAGMAVGSDGRKIKLLLGASHMQAVLREDVSCPGRALLLGPAYSIPQEFPGIDCTVVDVEICGGNGAEDELIRQLIVEMALCGNDRVTAFRDNCRWVRIFEPYGLPQRVTESSVLKHNGVYLVLGGLGGIGLELARHIAANGNSNLILTARRGLSDRDEATGAKVAEIEAMGSEVVIVEADAADRQQMEQVFLMIVQRFGRLDGVVHAAGGVDYGGIIQARKGKTAEADAFFAPKLQGALVLASLLREYDQEVDFVVFCSSLASVLPPFGEVAYVSVNAFLDAFVRSMNKPQALCMTRPVYRSINWGAWRDVGMAPVAVRKRGGDPALVLKNEISPEEGSRAFARILNAGLVQTAVSPRDLNALFLQMAATQNQNSEDLMGEAVELILQGGERHPRPDLDTPYAPPETMMEKQMAELWQLFFGLEQVGVDDDFFDLGGDSLKAMAVASMIHRQMNARITLADFFKHCTVRGLAGHIEKPGTEAYHAIEPVEEKEYYPVSAAQKRLFILHQLEGGSGGIGYNETSVVDLGGMPDMERLEAAFREIINRHESFRTSFLLKDDEPVQRIHCPGDIDFKIEIHGLEYDGELGSVDEKNIGAFIRPFDLSRAPLLRAHLLRHADDGCILIVDMHHIIVDGRSQELFTQEIIALYGGAELESLTVRYRDFTAWQRGMDVQGRIKEQEAYWLGMFSEEVPRLTLPLDFQRPPVQSMAGAAIRFTMGKEETAGLKALAAEHDVTLFMVLLSIYNVLLARLSGQEDIVVGTPISGRSHADLQPLIGMFVNTLALRNRVEGCMPFGEFLGQLKTRSLEAFENQDYPFEELVEHVTTGRDTGRNPIFDVVFTMEHGGPAPVGGEASTAETGEIAAGMPVPVAYDNPVSRFDLVLTAVDMETELSFNLQYATTLFKRETVSRFCDYFKRIGDALITGAASQGQCLSNIQLMGEDERNRVLVEFNRTEMDYPRDRTIVQLFEEQVLKYPAHVAVTGPGMASGNGNEVGNAKERSLALTYGELNRNAGLLAGALLQKGVGAGSIVALMMERSVDMITAIMGILKAGGAYVPIDPAFPAERIRFMMMDSAAKVCIANRSVSEEVNSDDNNIDILYMEDLQPLFLSHEGPVEPAVNIVPDDPAYVIYTSGTTGRPKGVVITHGNVVRLVRNSDSIGVLPEDRVLQLLNIAFDGSVYNMLGALLNGAVLVIVGAESVMSAEGLASVIIDERVTLFVITTALFNALVDVDTAVFAGVRKIMVGGETLSPRHMRKALSLLGPGRLINVYGPTESTVISNCFIIDHMAENSESIPIGPPIANTTAYIVDKYLNPVPIMVHGEIIIGGAGVAQGYLNRPELTAQMFMGHWSHSSDLSDSSHVSHRSYYRTGDMGYWRPDGSIEFVGRVDQQVKIRGFRIELEEIQHVIQKHDDVKKTVVMVRNDSRGEPFLCAYVVYNDGTGSGSDTDALRQYLASVLPAFMIPSSIIIMDDIPLTATGKVDKRGLPEPGITGNRMGEALQDDVEKTLAAIWAEVLKTDVSQLDTASHFFDLGGHSLTAMIMIARVEKHFNVTLPLAEVFKAPVLREMASYIKTHRSGLDRKSMYTSMDIRPMQKRAWYVLSPGQQRFFTFQQLEPDSTAYNIFQVLPLTGDYGLERLQPICLELIQRHESLRTSFRMEGNQAVQVVHDDVSLIIEYFENGNQPGVEKIVSGFVRPFDLSAAPLLRVGLIKISDQKYLLLFDSHHIINDGISQGKLIGDFNRLYKGEQLPRLRIQYKDYAEWWYSVGHRESLAKQREYWLNEFGDGLPDYDLPLDYPRNADRSYQGQSISFAVGGDQLDQLRQWGRDTGATLFMLLLAVYNVLLSKWCGKEEVIVGTVTAGRVHADFQDIIGVFLNTLALRNTPAREKQFSQLLEEIKTATPAAFDNQEYPFDELVNELAVKGVLERTANRNPLFDTMFTLRNFQFLDDETDEKVEVPAESALQGAGDTPMLVNANFDLLLTAEEQETTLRLTLDYSTALFKQETIKGLAARFMEILEQVLGNRDITLAGITVSRDSADVECDIDEEELMDFGF